MIRHYIEKGLVLLFLGISLWQAFLEHWGPGSYFLLLAAFVDFEDWSHRK